MTIDELKKAAENNDTEAILAYANHLYQETEYEEAQQWALKGAQLGDTKCAIVNALYTSMLAEAGMAITGAAAIEECKNLEEAERLLGMARDANCANEEAIANITNVTNRLYETMVCCYYIIALSTKDEKNWRLVIAKYNSIKARPNSRSAYAYFRALEALGSTKLAFEQACSLLNYDDILQRSPSELGLLFTYLCIAYLEGSVTKPNYNLALSYARRAKEADPESNIIDYFNSGEAKQNFENMHPHPPTDPRPIFSREVEDEKTPAPAPASSSDSADNSKNIWRIIGIIVLIYLCGSCLCGGQPML